MSYLAGKDPFYDAKDEVQKSLKNAKSAFDRWRILPDNKEASNLRRDLLEELRNIESDVIELNDTVNVVESDRSTYRLEDGEIFSRKQFIDGCRRTIQELRVGLNVPKTAPQPSSNSASSGSSRTPAPRPGASPDADVQHRQQLLERQTDEHLDELSRGVQRVHEIGIAIGDRVVEQSRLLDDTNEQATEAHDRLKYVSKALDSLLKDTSKGKLCTIGILVVIVIVLLFLVVYT
mmetsp:Transcript_28121/g.45595  ORF Transcript_28121/g.45595 Transcript_28121/m.45595 type:complete len:234 (+) Transcript_28121:75-776(+)|eukprot:CAMPEP_0184650866 /NCGR_PEP_ID=MMETSP0308-20130426/8442_1 /TAXON_ID=38269 /ORGANISM="Gloeochaete witrockiana, Strain SAG 46.84" /LENGTH=233 /DNA_ID=CAMNT_0027084697 /DNA_START=74 /DNA_END=775 /DNA_ORIENTATION=-